MTISVHSIREVGRVSAQIRFYCTRKNGRKASGLQKAFGKYLLLTNMCISGILLVAGDLIEQEIEYQRKKQPKRYDWERSGVMFLVGLGLGPLTHHFYTWLNRYIPARTARSIVRKVILDQCLMSPVSISYLFYAAGFLEGNTFKESTQELKQKFLKVYRIDWCFCMPAQLVNFYYVPARFQVLYVNVITMLYNVCWSYIKHTKD